MAFWGRARRDDRRINDVVDQLFCTRFLDKGTCNGCAKELMGIYGPQSHQKFYCRGCWNAYLKGVSDAEWEDWLSWEPVPRQCTTEKASHHELKCVLLALSRVGGSITFPPSLSSHDRFKVHEFCEEEPELTSLQTKSYGDGAERFLTVTSVGKVQRIAEARALLQTEAPDGSDDTDSTNQKPEKSTPDEQDVSVTRISQTLEQLALGTPAVVPAADKQMSEQPKPRARKSDTRDGRHEQTEPRAGETHGKATQGAKGSEGHDKAAPPPPPSPPQQPGAPQTKSPSAPPQTQPAAPQGKGESAKSPMLPEKGRCEWPPAEHDESAFPSLGSMAGSVKKGKKLKNKP